MNIKDIDEFNEYINELKFIGFQATELGRARELLKKMKEEEIVLYFGFTANLVASGLRGFIAKFIRSGLVDVIVTTGGAIDHDVIKSFMPYLSGSFNVDDKELHKQNINRIGNIFVPTDRYVRFEEISHEVMEKAMKKYGDAVAPSELINEYAEYVYKNSHDRHSFLRAAYEKNIPVFSPGITDSAIGLNAYFFKQRFEEFSIDVTKDMKKLADITINAEKTGAVILGGGITKHHIIGLNVVRGGLDYAIYITTASEWDGSLSGARTKEAVSWGKISEEGKHVTVVGDATILFPLLLKDII